MDIYEYEKSFLDRLEESMLVLSLQNDTIPTCEVKSNWSYNLELQIEPAGWQALWKLPRVICEESKVRYPTVVFGQVEQVHFKELKAIFVIEAVQDDEVHLPERHIVALIDLYPTKSQENDALNVEKTADCIDALRYFYTNVWMPWDGDGDFSWDEKRLEQRIRFCYDLRKRIIKMPLASHIRMLLNEARYLQQRREYLEFDYLNDDDECGSGSQEEPPMDKSKITELMRLHFRLIMIRSEIEMMENPEMRRVYEEAHLETDTATDDNQKCINETNFVNKGKGTKYYVVLSPDSIKRHMEMLDVVQKHVPEDESVQVAHSLQDTLNMCDNSAKFFVSPGFHKIKYMEYLDNNGTISGIIPNSMNLNDNGEIETKIGSTSDDEMLLGFDGHYTLRNLTLDCSLVRTGLLIKSGHICLFNCLLIGNAKTSTQQGIVCHSNSSLSLINCVLDGFASTLVLNENTKISMENVTIKNSHIGLDLIGSENVHIKAINCQICNASDCGLFISNMKLNSSNAKKLSLQRYVDLQSHLQTASGELNFIDCKTNICILNRNDFITKSAAKALNLEEELDAEVNGDANNTISEDPKTPRHCVSQKIELINELD